MPQDTSSTDGAESHDHSGMAMPAETGDRLGAPGRHVNVAALTVLVGAAIDGCAPCQRVQLDIVQTDPLTLTRLVELSAVAVQAIAGGLPDVMTTEDDAESTLDREYRDMLRAGRGREDHTPMYEGAVELSDTERRKVAEDALDMLTGVLAMGS
jgi:hypothetical protein